MRETLKATNNHDADWSRTKCTSRRPCVPPSLYLMLGIAALGVVPGCGSNSFVPSRPPELVSTPAAPARAANAASSAAGTPVAAAGAKPYPTAKARVRLIELLLARPPGLDRAYLEQFVRRYAGIKRCAFRTVKPKDEQPMTPEELAREIRTAANRSTGAILLEPIAAPEVTDALREAESRGLGVVLLDSPLPATSPGKLHPFVTFDGFAEAGKQLVETVFEDARLMRLPAEGTTLVLENRTRDYYSRDRLESITAALKAAGRTYDLVSFDGDQSGASQVVLNYLAEHPKATVILADHDFGVVGSYRGASQMEENESRLVRYCRLCRL